MLRDAVEDAVRPYVFDDPKLREAGEGEAETERGALSIISAHGEGVVPARICFLRGLR